MLELLAPAGSMDALRAAVQNGANAVYLGCGLFNARQSAKNFTTQTLTEAVKYCHVRGVAVHLTLNTLVSDRESHDLMELIRHGANSGVDAFIVQDLGVVELCRRIAPHVPIHGSTQMTIHNLSGVQLCAAMGMRRVVLSRELNKEEIRYICAHSPIEIEVFAHGALCMCYSGQCYMSAMIGGRSGNRGRCAQPCRQSYGYAHWEEKYPLSLKDNCLIHYLQELDAMGVASIKLEGRMKRPEYVATVTANYRRALDEGVVTRDMEKSLLTAFNRQGFTDGYYTSQVNRAMFGTRQESREDPAWIREARQSYETGENQRVDIGFQMLVTPTFSRLTVTDPEGRSCAIEGPVPEVARNVAITDQALTDRLCKTGGTPYRCVEVKTHVEPGLTLSAAAINSMRRDALNQLTAIRARHVSKPLGKPQRLQDYLGSAGQPGLTVQVTTREQITDHLLNLELAMLYVPLHILLEDTRLLRKLIARDRGSRDIRVGVVLPRIVHDDELTHIQMGLRDLHSQGIRHALVGNLGLLAAAREAGMVIHGDFGLNIYNSRALSVCKDMELGTACLSFELTMPQIRAMSKCIPTELIVYGRLPLMITEHCLMRNRTGQCTCNQGSLKLTDKTGAQFPIIKDGNSCRSVLLNGKKLFWLDRQEDLSKLGLWAVRLYFTTENAQETDRVLDDFIQGAAFDPGNCTRGLYLRGLD